MKKITISLGDAFLIDTPPRGAHLHIAIAKTTDERYLFVNVTTRRNGSETACTLNPGKDLPSFIRKPSVITYGYAIDLSAEDLAKRITPGSAVPKGKVAAHILKRIQQGGLISKRIRPDYKKYLRQLLKDES